MDQTSECSNQLKGGLGRLEMKVYFLSLDVSVPWKRQVASGNGS